MKTFLKSLDPKKLFFYQSDVDEFLTSQDRLDDLFKRGDIQFAHTVFTRFLDRIEERMETAQAMLDQEHDFTADEEMVEMLEAQRQYQNTIEVISTIRNLTMRTLNLGK